MLKINQIVKAVVKDVERDGTGILCVHKDHVFVQGALIGESVKVKITKRLKDGYAGIITEILNEHEMRVKPECNIYNQCGSCHYLHVQYAAQLQLKRDYVQSLCKQHHLSIKVHDVEGMHPPYAYRNKMIVGFTKDKKKNIVAGFYEENSHRIIPYRHCLMHDLDCDNIIQTIVHLMKKYRIEPYDEDHKKGLLRHVMIRQAKKTKEIMVVLVFGQKVFPGARNFISGLIQECPYITTVIQNMNVRKTSVVLGDEERVLYGPGFIMDELCHLKFRISSKSFYQINHDQCEKLYEKAIELLDAKGNERILDAYCGIGTIGMYAASYVKEVIGVEINKHAVLDAQKNAKQNHVKNIRFVCDDAGKFMVKSAQQKQHIDAVIMDPPRAGSTPVFMDAVYQLHPHKVIYISCEPATLVRDILYFKKLGYQTQELFLYDMFPNTYHVESIALLYRK